jgi:ABC-type branched-subunit amino acid transport system substrate-binding protein
MQTALSQEHNLPVEFFDLKTKLAGDILQKFSTYQGRLAIVGDFTKYESKSLRDFIYESNKARRINFVSTLEEAENALAQQNKTAP